MQEKENLKNNSTITDKSVSTAELDSTIQSVSHNIEDAITKEIGITKLEETEVENNNDITETKTDSNNLSNEIDSQTSVNNSEEELTEEEVAEESKVSLENDALLDEPQTELTEEERKILEAKESAKWYVLHTFSSYENVAKENLEIVVEKFNLQYRIFDIVIPMEDVVEEKNGKKQIVQRKVMPGYILVKMNYGDDIWHAVTRTRGITGFVGPKGRPLHLTQEEIRKMQLEKSTVIDITIAVNDKVEVLEGPLNGFTGTVVSVDAVSHKCRVIVEMFGRETPVDLMLNQIRKLD